MLGGQTNLSFQVELKERVPRRGHCSDALHAGVPWKHPAFTLKLFGAPVAWNVFKLSELKNLQVLDRGRV